MDFQLLDQFFEVLGPPFVELCAEVSLVMDGLIEEAESFLIELSTSARETSVVFGIRSLVVQIMDSDGTQTTITECNPQNETTPPITYCYVCACRCGLLMHLQRPK